jgi:hypothetical protein
MPAGAAFLPASGRVDQVAEIRRREVREKVQPHVGVLDIDLPRLSSAFRAIDLSLSSMSPRVENLAIVPAPEHRDHLTVLDRADDRGHNVNSGSGFEESIADEFGSEEGALSSDPATRSLGGIRANISDLDANKSGGPDRIVVAWLIVRNNCGEYRLERLLSREACGRNCPPGGKRGHR